MLDLNINVYNFPALLSAVLNVALIGYVATRRQLTRVHISFCVWNVVLTIWNLGACGIYGATTAVAANCWARFCCIGVVFVPVSFLGLVLMLKKTRITRTQRYLLSLSGVLGALFLLAEFLHPGYLSGEVVERFWGYGPIGGSGSIWMDPFLGGISIYALCLLWGEIRLSDPIRKNQLMYVFGGSLVAFVGAIFNVLMIHGVNVYPFGNLTNIFYSGLVAYAIIAHQWMGVPFMLRKGGMSLCVGLIVACGYMLAFHIVSVLSDKPLSGFLQFFLIIPLPLACHYLNERVERWLDERFFYQTSRLQMAREWGWKLAQFLDLNSLASFVVHQMGSLLGFRQSMLWVHTGSKKWELAAATDSFQQSTSNPGTISARWFEGENSSEQFLTEVSWRNQTHKLISKDQMSYERWLQRSGGALSVPLQFQGRLLGVWVLGDMGPDSSMEVHRVRLMVRTFVSQLTLALFQVLSFRERSQAMEGAPSDRPQKLLGLFAKELTHELARPFSRILQEGFRIKQDHSSAGLDRIETEVFRAQGILESFSALYPEQDVPKTNMPVHELLEESLRILGLDQEPHLKIRKQYGEVQRLMVHPGQITRAFTNILQNAFEAMRGRGTITLSISQCQLQESTGVEIAISDSGPGIAPSLLERVVEPFVTSKSDGAQHGMGLTIARMMIERHGGAMHVQSPIYRGKGTRITFRIP